MKKIFNRYLLENVKTFLTTVKVMYIQFALCVCVVEDQDSGSVELPTEVPIDMSQTPTVRSVFYFTVVCFLDKLRLSPRHWLLSSGFVTRLLGLFLALTDDVTSLMCYNLTGCKSNTDIQWVVYGSVTSLYLHWRLSVTLFTVIIDLLSITQAVRLTDVPSQSVDRTFLTVYHRQSLEGRSYYARPLL